MKSPIAGVYFFVLVTFCAGAYFLGKIQPKNIPEILLPQISSTIAEKKQEDVTLPDLSLRQIFTVDHAWVATLSAEKTRTMIATGDVIPARSVNNTAVKKQSFIWPYEKTAEFLKSADLTLINLESPLLATCAATTVGMSFCGDARNIEGMKYAGVDIAGLANNHSGNYGKIGVEETVHFLSAAGISTTGMDNQFVVKNIRGVKFAFLSYNDIGSKEQGIAWADESAIHKDIASIKTKADLVIVSFHWGIEYERLPGQRQRDLAHFAIDNGADVVVGNHPHWIQPPEIYNGKFIMYAHGNFIFDQEWSEETKLGVVGKYTFYDSKLIDVEFTPIRIVDYGQPYILETPEKQKVIEMLKNASEELSRM